jgi:hypothetical protein
MARSHLCEFALRDFLNTERSCRRNSIIALHDCLPLDFTMAQRQCPPYPEGEADLLRAGRWTGDVWRCALLLKRCRPDLRMTMIDAYPTGLALITNLDPSSSLLRERYASAVEEMHAMSLRELTLPGLHAKLNVEPASVLAGAEQLAARFRI